LNRMGDNDDEFAAKRREKIAHSLFEAGNSAYERGDALKADKLYTKALSLSPSEALRCTILSNRSAVRLKAQDHQGAVADAREAIRLNPCWAKAHHRLGSALIAGEKLADAWLCFKTARELDRQNLLYQTTMKNVEQAMLIRGEEAELEEIKAKSATSAAQQYVANHDDLMSDHLSKVGWLKICTPKSLKWEKRYVELSHHGEVFMSSDTFGADREPLIVLGDNAIVIPSIKYSRTLKIYGQKLVPFKAKLKMETHEQYIAWTKACKAEVGKSRSTIHAKELTALRLKNGKDAKRLRDDSDKTIKGLQHDLATERANNKADLANMLAAAAVKGATHSGRKSWASVMQMKKLQCENKMLRAQVAALTDALHAKGGRAPPMPSHAMMMDDAAPATGDAKRAELQRVFNVFDANSSGSLNLKETAMLMKKLQLNPTDEQLINMVEAADADNSGEIDFEEFVVMMSIAKVTMVDLGKVEGATGPKEDSLRRRNTSNASIRSTTSIRSTASSQGPPIPSHGAGVNAHRTKNAKVAAQWTTHSDPASGKQYYFNEKTRVTQWHAPSSADTNGALAGGSSSAGGSGMTDRQVARTMFDSFDEDNSGSISSSELLGAMHAMGLRPSAEDLQKMLLAGDTDNDGEIDFEEFVILMANISKLEASKSDAGPTRTRSGAGTGSSDSKAQVGEAKQGTAVRNGTQSRERTPAVAAAQREKAPAVAAAKSSSVVKLSKLDQQQTKEARTLFDRFDVDRSGSINADELVAVLSHLGHFPTPDELHEMLDVADSDKNGELSFNEFLQMLSLVPRDTEWEEFEDASSGKPYFRHKGSGKVMWNRLEEMSTETKQQLQGMFPPGQSPSLAAEAKQKR